MSCSCDYEQPEFFSQDFRKAKKQHKCCECGHIIQPGEVYESTRGKWAGDFSAYVTCERCADLRASLNDAGGCAYFGGLGEEYFEFLLTELGGDDARKKYYAVMARHLSDTSSPLVK